MKKATILFLLPFLVLSLSIEALGQSWVWEYWKEGSHKYNIGDFRSALEVWNKGLNLANDKLAIGVFMRGIGNVYRNLGDYSLALSYLEQGLKIQKQIGNRKNEGITLTDIGMVYLSLGDSFRALSYLEQGLKIHREVRDRGTEGLALERIGLAYLNLGDYSHALSYLEQGLKIYRKIKNRRMEGILLEDIGILYGFLSDYPHALYYFEQGAKIHKEVGNRRNEGSILINIGAVYLQLGDYSLALSYLEQGLKVHREIGNRKAEGSTLTVIGIVYRNLGDYSQALSNLEQALEIQRDIGAKNSEAGILKDIGIVHSDLGDHLKAISYYQEGLKIRKEIGVPTRALEINIGEAYLEQGMLKEAYEIFKKLNAPIQLGRYYLKTKEYERAKEKFFISVKKEEAKEMPNAESLLAGYIGLGHAHEGMKDYEKAKEYFQKGIALIEKQREGLGVGERERFLEAKVKGFPRLEPYEGMVRVLLKEKGQDSQRDALFYAERAKSRSFIEILATRAIKGRKEGDRNILEREKAYQQELLVLRKRIEVAEEHREKVPEGELERLTKEFKQKELEYERFIKEVKLKDSELASLISPNPISVDKIQSFLDEDTTLLEYYTTKDTLYLWIVTKTEIKVYETTLKEKDLQNKVDALILPNISNKSRRVEPVIVYVPNTEKKKETPEKEREENRDRFLQVVQDLYKDIISPIEKDIKTANLIIVPHGVLHKVPFSVLSDGVSYLLDKYTLSVLPAASVMEFAIKKRKPDKERLLVFGNPETDHAPLVFGEVEGNVISKLFPKNELYFREEATETLAKNKSANFNIIHFATHGEFNDRQPLQSGLLLTKDKENDGFLQVHEIFEMDLNNANLVTLSACETALSKVQGGDDLVGLARGFIYAGTPSILATLWEVDDASTAKLMEYFYQSWKQGMSKSEALKRAQISLKNIPQYEHPYYWGAFVMIGDWK